MPPADPHAFANDTQICGFSLDYVMPAYFPQNVRLWWKDESMDAANHLQANSLKTKVGSLSAQVISYTSAYIMHIISVCMWISLDVTMQIHVAAAVRSRFSALRKLRSMWWHYCWSVSLVTWSDFSWSSTLLLNSCCQQGVANTWHLRSSAIFTGCDCRLTGCGSTFVSLCTAVSML